MMTKEVERMSAAVKRLEEILKEERARREPQLAELRKQWQVAQRGMEELFSDLITTSMARLREEYRDGEAPVAP